MKGPRSRYRFAIQRIWTCPLCQRRTATGGHVTTLRCICAAALSADPPVWMTLAPEPRRARPPTAPETAIPAEKKEE